MRLAFLLGWAGMLAAQAVSIGVKGGVRGTDDLGGTFGTSESKRYVVGPMLTARLPLGFRLEFDALYRRVGFRSFMNTDIGGSVAERDTGNSWEFPILVRRTLWHGLYAGVGYAPRVISGLRHFDEVSILSLTPPLKAYSEFSLPGSWDTTDGVVVEGGIEKRAGRLRIAPELRYIHWSPHALNVQQPHGQFMYPRKTKRTFSWGSPFWAQHGEIAITSAVGVRGIQVDNGGELPGGAEYRATSRELAVKCWRGSLM